MDRGQRKRLADICEKLGVALLAGAALQAILAETTTGTLLLTRLYVITVGLGLLGIAIHLSKEQ